MNKIKSKKGSVELVTIIISIVIFAAIGFFFAKTILGSKTAGTGIGGASSKINGEILNNVP